MKCFLHISQSYLADDSPTSLASSLMFLTILADDAEDDSELPGADDVLAATFFSPGFFLAASDARTLLAPVTEDTRTVLGP